MHGIGMERQIVLLREMEDADQVDRIALERILVGDGNAIVVNDEIVGFAQRAPRARPEPRHHPAEHRHRLGLTFLELAQRMAVRSPTSLAMRK